VIKRKPKKQLSEVEREFGKMWFTFIWAFWLFFLSGSVNNISWIISLVLLFSALACVGYSARKYNQILKKFDFREKWSDQNA